MGNSPRYVGFIDPPYIVTLTDDSGAALDLTGCISSSFTLTMINAKTGLSQQCAGVWTIANQTTNKGQVSYQWTNADMATAGLWSLYTTVKLPAEPGPREFDPELIEILPGTVGAGTAPPGVLPTLYFPALPYRDVVLSDAPIRYYRMNESSGTVATDLGSQATNGTLHGSITLAQPALISRDSSAASMSFASSAYIDIPTTGLPTGASPWTMEAWIQQPTILSLFQRFFSMGLTGTLNRSVFLLLTSGNSFLLDFWGNAMGGSNGGTSIFANGIYYVAATYDGAIASFYIYGGGGQVGLLQSEAVTLNLTYSGGFANIGTANNGNTDPYTGRIAECAIYNYALSPAQIFRHYVAGMGVR